MFKAFCSYERLTISNLKMLESKQKPSMPRPAKPNKRIPPPQSAPLEVVSPVWLVKAIGLTVLAALLCGYLTFCLLFYQGQWQLVLHPVRTSSSPASIAGIPYEFIHFGPDESATPQLTGWWIPSDAGARYATFTVLFLPNGDGALTDSIPTLASLHNLGINVFAFDYRGYGQSASARPNQQSLTHDADSAWRYLITSRHIAAQQIIPYGTGVGASLATHLAAVHDASPALILDAPRADLLNVVMQDPRSTFIPVHLLFHDRFPLAQPLSTLQTPKLLLSRSVTPDKGYLTASNPKVSAELPSPSLLLYKQSIVRFLDQYLPLTPVPRLMPSPAPAH